MKFKISVASILIVLALMGITANSAQAATVGGAVLDANGNPVLGALVTIQQIDVPRGQRAYAARIVSGRGGRYIFEGIPGGHYIVRAQTRTASVRAEVSLRANGVERVQLVLPGRRDGGNVRD